LGKYKRRKKLLFPLTLNEVYSFLLKIYDLKQKYGIISCDEYIPFKLENLFSN